MKIDPYVLEAIKGMDLPKLMQGYGLVLKPAGKNAYQTRCPFHDDTTPSLSVGFKNNKWIWNCFGCHTHGNYLDFQMTYEKIPFTEAYEKNAAELRLVPPETNGHASPVPPPSASDEGRPPTVNRSELLSRAVQIYHEAFQEDRRGADYLAGRGIKDGELFKQYKIGFVDGRLRRMLPNDADHEFVRGLKEVGILNEKGTERFYNCVVFPIFDENGAVVGLYGRNIRKGWIAAAQHLYLPGPHRGVWNGAAIKAHKDIVLTESVIDALSLVTAGVQNAVPIYGTNGLTEEHLRQFREHRTERVFLCLDNDAAGERARQPVTEKLEALGIEVLSYDLPKNFKDPNDALMKGFPGEELLVLARIQSVLATARKTPELFSSAGEINSTPKNDPKEKEPPPTSEAAPPAPASAAAPVFPMVEQREDGVYVAFGPRLYRVWELGALGSLRVKIKVEAPDGNHMDTLDLYSAKSRQSFVGCCRKLFEANEGELLKELNRLIEALEKIQAFRKVEDKPDAPPKMSPEEEGEALAALQSPTLYADVLHDMEALGYVGEEANKGIGYLVGVSRKLDDPLSCVIISQSSAGKSVLAEIVEKLCPPEDVLALSRATPQAFFYIVKDGLRHKLVIMEERVGAENADYAIRTLQSKKKLSQAVTLKDERTGEMKTRFFEVQGPVAYIETTTKPRIHEENATRCFELYLDESAAQTLRIHMMQREGMTLTGLERHGRLDRLIRRHHNMQRLLRGVAVVIPYAPLIDFPTAWLRTRRDHPRFFNLIRVVAFLHQRQREVKKTADGAEYIESTVDDYRIAYGLAKAVMGESFTELKKPQRELLMVVVKLAEERGDVSRREVREAAGLPNRRCWELLEDLFDLEYLEKPQGRPGQTCRYRPTEGVVASMKTWEGLTTPEELAARLKLAK